MKIKLWGKVIKELYLRLERDDIPALGAQVTYYLILSFFPFLIFVVTLLTYTNLASSEYLTLLSTILPGNIYTLASDVVANIMDTRDKAFISFGMLATIWSASTGALAFITGINKAYKIKETRPFWKVRLISIFFIVALSMVIIFSFILIIFGGIISEYAFNKLGVTYMYKSIWNVLRFTFIVATMFVVFMFFYFYTPNCKIYIKDVFPGSILSTIGWMIISVAFSFYVNNFGSFSKTYGSIGAVIGLLIWLYWSSILVLTGGELNAVLLEKKNGVICRKRKANRRR